MKITIEFYPSSVVPGIKDFGVTRDALICLKDYGVLDADMVFSGRGAFKHFACKYGRFKLNHPCFVGWAEMPDV